MVIRPCWVCGIACGIVLAISSSAPAQILSSVSHRVIPGTENIPVGPRMQADHMMLSSALLLLQNVNYSTFEGSNLSHANFSFSQSNFVNFRDANLSQANFRLASLLKSDFNRADLSDAIMDGATLLGADLTDARFTRVNFLNAILADATFTGAVVDGASFRGTTNMGFTRAQLESTYNYQSKTLSGINLGENSLPDINLSHFNLTGTLLDYGNFANANFSQSQLRKAKLTSSDLTGANFRGAQMIDADLTAAKATYADFRDANLTNAGFASADLSQALFDGAKITGAVFVDTIPRGFTRAMFESTASYRQRDLTGIGIRDDLTNWDFSGQKLVNARITGVLNGTNFAFADLSGARLEGAQITQADFTGANLSRASFYASDFTGVQLTGATIRSMNLQHATNRGLTYAELTATASYQKLDLAGIVFADNNLSGWNFRGQNLQSVDFTNARLQGTDFVGADLRGARIPNSAAIIPGNTIDQFGRIHGLHLRAGDELLIRNDDPQTSASMRSAIPIRIREELILEPQSQLHFLLTAKPWNSTITLDADMPTQWNGDLHISFADDVIAAALPGRTFQLFNWNGETVASDLQVQTDPGEVWDLSQLKQSGVVTLLGIAGDLDSDRDVDSLDLLGFLGNWTGVEYGAADKTWHDGDADFDGDIDINDLLSFLGHWTGSRNLPVQPSEPESLLSVADVAAVPEPSGGVRLLCLLSCVLLRSTLRRP